MSHPLHDAPIVSVDMFREAMSRLCAAVNVVTTAGPAGAAGATVTAVSSVTDTPPSLLVCVNRNAYSNAVIRANGVMCVNVLSAGTDHIADLFAGRGNVPGPERITHVRHTFGPSGSPMIDDALVAFDCRVQDMIDIGSHTIFIGSVLRIACPDRADRRGLMYVARRYVTVPPMPDPCPH